jgi:hypothetical protein
MTPDELVAEIFRIQNERNPDADPGDLTIEIQDDMPMVLVWQAKWRDSDRFDIEDFVPDGMGTTIQAALEDALTNVLAKT